MQTSKTHIVINSLLLTIVFSTLSILSTAKGNEEQAKKLFADENYSEALPLYQELNLMYPNDATFQYGLGVCLTETMQYGQRAKKLLLQASLSKMSPKVYFYIGKNYHALNNFDVAKKYYTRFAENAKKKFQKDVNYKSIVKACYGGVNPFVISNANEEVSVYVVESDTIPIIDSPVIISNTELDSVSPLINSTTEKIELPEINQMVDTIVKADTIITTEPILKIEQNNEASISTKQISNELTDTIFSFILSSSIEYLKVDQFKTTDGRTEFIKGWIEKKELNDLLLEIERLRTVYSNSKKEDEKASISQNVLNLELSLPIKKEKSDQAFYNARKAELIFWNNSTEQDLKKLKFQNDSITAVKVEGIKERIVTKDSIALTTKIDTLDVFELDTIQNVNIEAPVSIVYKIQIGAYSKGLPEYVDILYKKLSVLRKINKYTDERGIVVYTVGEVSNFDDAIKLQKQIRQEGVKDAFVVAYNNGKRITLSEAREITNND
ncbi:MAG: hypothetical protein PF541_08785 [Prolixibacteraceae bacterium]|jgi:tetratricopeptide (TPR) repeat protein|nr:hypothetical protein [Prolixibacteraceae bacterium]